jgi:Putative MetA-pathway of phenol degradation
MLRYSVWGLFVLVGAGLCLAQTAPDGWSERVQQTEAGQPYWPAPLITNTARLTEEFRYDLGFQQQPLGDATIYGNGKGLQLMPAGALEILVGVPPYTSSARGAAGWGDLPVRLKYRLASEPLESGNYVVSAMLGASLPTGAKGVGSGATVLTPALAVGKGWGRFSAQNNIAVAFPLSSASRIGNAVTFNTALQYRLPRKFWPEIEFNGVHWPNGQRAGNTQVFVTPGIVLGRIRLSRRASVTLGAGFQTAITHYHLYNHSVLVSMRVPFR